MDKEAKDTLVQVAQYVEEEKKKLKKRILDMSMAAVLLMAFSLLLKYTNGFGFIPEEPCENLFNFANGAAFGVLLLNVLYLAGVADKLFVKKSISLIVAILCFVVVLILFLSAASKDVVKEETSPEWLVLEDGVIGEARVGNKLYAFSITDDGTVYASKVNVYGFNDTVKEAIFDLPKEFVDREYSDEYWQELLEYVRKADLDWKKTEKVKGIID